ncbi:Uncharacterised protein family UPF0758 [Cardinium endosymbiont of Oedothorax gibbosus]|nr:Uncharacterised protein family UPF0758 [Cardinium endosymbiont of Oedothorax gibbosus]
MACFIHFIPCMLYLKIKSTISNRGYKENKCVYLKRAMVCSQHIKLNASNIMNKNLNNYFYKLGLLFASTLCMNFTNKLVYCSLIFTFLMLILNCIAKCHGSKKATISIILCTSTSLALLCNKQYYIAGKLIRGLIPASLCAILIASYIGFKLFLKLKARYGFTISNCISLYISALVDHLIMGIFFTRIFPIHKIWLMIYKETAYTCLFTVVVYLCSVTVLYAKPIYRKLKKHLHPLVWFCRVYSKK